MADFTFEAPNLAAYERKLLDLGTKQARVIGRKALRSGTNVVLKEARRLVKGGHPDYPNKITGLLAKSLRTRDQGIKGDTITFSVDVSRQAFYAGFVEFGTVRSRPFPFLRPAAEGKAQEAVRVITESIGLDLTDTWKRPV